MENYDMVTILGPTASGKTGVGTHLAKSLEGEIISADSRQIYRGMDLGTGKDIDEYTIDGTKIPHHLIDIVDAGYQYNIFEYQRDFVNVYDDIQKRKVFPVFCGGSGMYLEAVLKGYRLIEVPPNPERRAFLETQPKEDLIDLLRSLKHVHNNSDIDSKKRVIRAIEIEEYLKDHPTVDKRFPEINSLIVGIDVSREVRRERISKRLKVRFEEGMLEEVQSLLDSGLTPESLIYYGLEYKYMTLHLTGELSYDEMFTGLETSIHQFAKRQMTWFRKMERAGFDIKWLDGNLPMEAKIAQIHEWMKK